MIGGGRWIPLLSAVLLGGCGPDLLDAKLNSVTPDHSYTGVEASIDLLGANFYPAIRVDPASSGGDQIDAQFEVALLSDSLEVPLDGVQLVDYGQISAQVPAGLPLGSYDVQLLTPSGQTVALSDAFTVTDSAADRLVIGGEARPWTVLERAMVPFQLVDVQGNPVYEDISVVVTVTADTGSSLEGVSIWENDLEDVETLGSPLQLRGRMGSDSEAFVGLSSSAPTSLWVRVSPDDVESVVADDVSSVQFVPGDLTRVEISLPTVGFQGTAGEPFPVTISLVDALGNLLTDRNARVGLKEGCTGQVVLAETLIEGGSAEVMVAVQTATIEQAGDLCDINYLEATTLPGGFSAFFEVQPASAAGFEVLIGGEESTPTVVAGTGELTVLVRAVDNFGNINRRYGEPLRFFDALGGLDTDVAERGSVDCREWVQGHLPCGVSLNRAGSTPILVESRAGLTGASRQVEVVADSPALLVANSRSTEVIAGEDYELELRLMDIHSNPVGFDPTAGQGVQVSDAMGGTQCSFARTETDEWQVFDCRSTITGEQELQVSVPDFGVSDRTDIVTVNNAALAQALVVVPSTVEAGRSFLLEIEGRDAFGNAYTLGDRSIELSDTTGSLDITSASLGSGGMYSGVAHLFTAASSTTIQVSQGSVPLGSASMVVTAGALDGLNLEATRAWAWTGTPLQVQVRGEDVYGNLVESFQGPVTLSSIQGLFSPITVSDFSQGAAQVDVTWDDPGIGDRLHATDNVAVSGSSGLIDALDSDCSSAPTAALLLDGQSETESCLIGGPTQVNNSAAGSSAGGASIDHYLFHDGDGEVTRSTVATYAQTYADPGLYVPQVVVVDTAACGAVADAVLWVNDKGAPAGRVSVTLGHSSRDAGAQAADADTTVSVTATDCAGDPASSATLLLRTDLGELTTGVQSGANGWEVTLDSAGAAQATWSAQSVAFDGAAQVLAGVASGAAWGSAELEVIGDSTRPQVIDVSPVGTQLGVISSITLLFSEPMPAATADHVALAGPAEHGGITTEFDNSGRLLEIVPTIELDGSLGEFTVTVDASLTRDDNGNRLDGERVGSTTDFVASLGDVPDDANTMVTCSVNTAGFTPDGVGGSGTQSDDVSVVAVAADPPDWWRIDVYNAIGQRVRTTWSAPSGASDTLTWDGRADDGRVLAADNYSLVVRTVDPQGNHSPGCTTQTQLIEAYVSPD